MVKIIKGSMRLIKPEDGVWPDSSNYKWVVTEPYYCELRGRKLSVPIGFLSDGSSGGPDWGTVSWLYHDFLYATHKFDDGTVCSRKEADDLMEAILYNENHVFYATMFAFVAWLDWAGLFSEAWSDSFHRGDQYSVLFSQSR